MKSKKKIVLDFDECYKDMGWGDDVIFLSSKNIASSVVNINSFKNNLEKDVHIYESEWERNMDSFPRHFKRMLKAHSSSFFRDVILILGRWTEAIDYCFSTFEVEEVVLSSYSNSSKIFVYEAESEKNTAFLYKHHYYLPFYLRDYISKKYSTKVTVKKEVSFLRPFLSSHLRNIVLPIFLFAKVLMYKSINIFIKNSRLKVDHKIKYLISSRSIVQTDFIQKFLQKKEMECLLIANEQSFRPHRHFKYLKGKRIRFVYSEGSVSWNTLLKVNTRLVINLFKIRTFRNHFIDFNGIKISYSDFLGDLLSKELDYIYYSESVNRQIQTHLSHINKDNVRLLCFDMFTPHSYYLKDTCELKTIQIQTTFVEPKPNPDFVGGDKFYFSNPISYQDFIGFNSKLMPKLGCLPYLKYYGVEKSTYSGEKIKNIVYFSQPVKVEEEKLLLNSIKEFAKNKSATLMIKPHPRDQNMSFDIDNITTFLLSKVSSNEEAILSADLLITRSSSIGLDAWAYGVPIIFARLSSQNTDIFYAPKDYYGSVFSLNDLQLVLENFEVLTNKFKGHKLNADIRVNSDLIDNLLADA